MRTISIRGPKGIMCKINEQIEELEHVLSWQLCEFCKIVDKDRSRSTVGHICSVCGIPSKGGHMYFGASVYLIVDLIKNAFTSEHKVEHSDTSLEYKLNTHYISVLLFFCTLRELLSLITDLCISQKIPENIYDLITSDNKLHIQKQDKLFKSLTGSTWSSALKEIDETTSSNYAELNKKVQKLVDLRNHFAHKGSSWDINEDTGIECIANISQLIKMYVELNNKYVHKMP